MNSRVGWQACGAGDKIFAVGRAGSRTAALAAGLGWLAPDAGGGGLALGGAAGDRGALAFGTELPVPDAGGGASPLTSLATAAGGRPSAGLAVRTKGST